MTKEEAKQYYEELRELEMEIKNLEMETIAHLTIGELYSKLISLMFLGGKRLQLSENIKTIERLSPRE